MGKGSHEDFSLRYRDLKVKKVIIIGLVYGALDTGGDDNWGESVPTQILMVWNEDVIFNPRGWTLHITYELT